MDAPPPRHRPHPTPCRVVRQGWADRVISPGNDWHTEADRAAFMASHPYNYLHVNQRDPSHPDAPAEALRSILAAGAFTDVRAPGFYLYRLATATHTQTGLVCDLPVHWFHDGTVLGHERVHPDRVDRLVAQLTAVPVISNPIAVAHTGGAEVETLVLRSCRRAPLVVVTSLDGVTHTIWDVDPRDATELVGSIPIGRLYLVDGHHRAAAEARLARTEGRDERVLTVLAPMDGLHVEAFHRLVRGPISPGMHRVLATAVTAEPLGTSEAPIDTLPSPLPGRPVLRSEGSWWRLTLDEAENAAGVAGLDVTRLHRQLLDPMIEASPASDRRPIETLAGREGARVAATEADRTGGCAVLLAPVTPTQVMEVADRGETMPPKSTYFSPKTRSGLLLRNR